MTRSPVPVRQRFRPGTDEIPDDVLEQIAEAGDRASPEIGYCVGLDFEARIMVDRAIRGLDADHPDQPLSVPEWRVWSTAARWAARLLGVEVRP